MAAAGGMKALSGLLHLFDRMEDRTEAAFRVIPPFGCQNSSGQGSVSRHFPIRLSKMIRTITSFSISRPDEVQCLWESACAGVVGRVGATRPFISTKPANPPKRGFVPDVVFLTATPPQGCCRECLSAQAAAVPQGQEVSRSLKGRSGACERGSRWVIG